MDRLKEGGQYTLFAEIYAFLKLWANRLPELKNDQLDSAWTTIVSEADQLGRKYKGQPIEALAAALVIATVNELERLSRTA